LTISIEEIHEEVKIIRRELQDIKAMLVEEVEPSASEIAAVKEGRKEFSDGKFQEWKPRRKKETQ
jgi:hypothetical protein